MTDFIDTLVQRSIHRGSTAALQPAPALGLSLAAPVSPATAIPPAAILPSAPDTAATAPPPPTRATAVPSAPRIFGLPGPMNQPAVGPDAQEASQSTTIPSREIVAQPQSPERLMDSMVRLEPPAAQSHAPRDVRPAPLAVTVASPGAPPGAAEVALARSEPPQAAPATSPIPMTPPAPSRTVIEPRSAPEAADITSSLPAELGFQPPLTSRAVLASQEPAPTVQEFQEPPPPGRRLPDKSAIRPRTPRQTAAFDEGPPPATPEPRPAPTIATGATAPAPRQSGPLPAAIPQQAQPLAVILPRTEPAAPFLEPARPAATRRSVDVHIGSIEVRLVGPPQTAAPLVAPPAPVTPPAGFGDYAARRSYRGGEEWP